MSLRPIYVIENQDWLAPKSALSDEQAHAALVDLYQNGMTDDQWALACADLRNAGLPVEEQHARYVEMCRGEQGPPDA